MANPIMNIIVCCFRSGVLIYAKLKSIILKFLMNVMLVAVIVGMLKSTYKKQALPLKRRGLRSSQVVAKESH